MKKLVAVMGVLVTISSIAVTTAVATGDAGTAAWVKPTCVKYGTGPTMC